MNLAGQQGLTRNGALLCGRLQEKKRRRHTRARLSPLPDYRCSEAVCSLVNDGAPKFATYTSPLTGSIAMA